MRVGFVYPYIFGEDAYPRDIYRLCNEITRLGKVEIVPIPSAPLKGNRAKLGIAEIAILPELMRQIKTLDRIHFFGFFSPGYPLLAQLIKTRKVPYWVSPLGQLLPYALAEKNFKKDVFLKIMGKNFLQNAERIHAFTSNEVEAIRALGIDTACVKHSLGIYFEDTPANAEELPSLIDQPYLLCMGRLSVKHKGIDIVLDGFAEYIRAGNSKFRLVIAGRSWHGSHAYIQARIEELNLHERVTFMGEVSLENKFSLMQHCAALLYPTRHDGPPRPIRDALALRKRVLITFEANIIDDMQSLGWGYQFAPNPLALSRAIHALAAETASPVYVDPVSVLSWDKIALDFSNSYLEMK